MRAKKIIHKYLLFQRNKKQDGRENNYQEIVCNYSAVPPIIFDPLGHMETIAENHNKLIKIKRG